MSDPITDRRGTVFDPLRHLHRDGVPTLSKSTGLFMPRGGRKPKAVSTTAPQPASPPAALASPTPSTMPEPAATTPAASVPPPSPAPAAPPPDFSDLKKLLAGDTAPRPEGEPKKDAPPPVDRSDDAAEVLCRSIQLFFGFIFDAADDCRLPGAEHKDMVGATAAWIRYRGWQFTATASFVLLWFGYLLRLLDKPKPAAKVRRWFGMDAKNVTPPGGPSPARADGRPGAASPIILLPPTSKLG